MKFYYDFIIFFKFHYLWILIYYKFYYSLYFRNFPLSFNSEFILLMDLFINK